MYMLATGLSMPGKAPATVHQIRRSFLRRVEVDQLEVLCIVNFS
jgi:hypothetical protein